MRVKTSMKMDAASMQNIMKNLARYAQDTKEGAKQGLRDFAERVMIESAEECPKDTWTLVGSRWMHEPIEAADMVSIEVGYAGENVHDVNPKTGVPVSQYAVKVHEDMVTTFKVGKSKFLEDPVRRNTEKFIDLTAMNIKSHTKARYG